MAKGQQPPQVTRNMVNVLCVCGHKHIDHAKGWNIGDPTAGCFNCANVLNGCYKFTEAKQ